MSGRDHDPDLDAALRRRVSAALRLLAVDPPVVRRPPSIAARRRRRGTAVIALVAVLLFAATAAGLAAHDRGSRGGSGSPVAVASPSARASAGAPSAAASTAPSPRVAGGQGNQPAPTAAPGHGGSPVRCESGQNGGATAPGVTANRIQIGMTVAQTGAMAPEWSQTRDGVLAVLVAVNQAGGVCGRELSLATVDDGGDAARGRQAIDGFIAGGQTFAVLAPTPPGLASASAAGDLDRAGMPAVGYDAADIPALDDPWAWPVLSPSVAVARAMAHDAAARGARSYAFVYDSSLADATAFAGAFQAQLRRDGGAMAPGCLIDVGGSGVAPAYASFQHSCGTAGGGGGVDFVGFGLGPSAQQQWLTQAQADPGAYWGVRSNGSGQGAGSVTPYLRTTDLSKCGSWCLHVWSWGGNVPDVAPFSGTAAMQNFARACAAVSSTCDPHDAHTQAGYAAAQLLVAALQELGPVVTRAGLRSALDAAVLDDGVILPLRYLAGTHTGAQEMRPAVATTVDQSGNPQSFAWAAPALLDPCPPCSDPPVS